MADNLLGALPAADPHVHKVMNERGWILVDRAPEARGDQYDWNPSAPIEEEPTYLIVEGDAPRERRYRLSLANGERRTYHTTDELLTDLDAIETYRATTPMGRGPLRPPQHSSER